MPPGQNTGASAEPTGLSSATEPSSTVSALSGFDPSRLAASVDALMLSELRNVAEGKPTVPGFGSPVWHLKCLGYVEERTIHKPCRTCGTPQVDYHYNKITESGRAVLAAIAIEAGTAATVKQGAVRSTKARVRRTSPKGGPDDTQ